jgi:hypothetical protein
LWAHDKGWQRPRVHMHELITHMCVAVDVLVPLLVLFGNNSEMASALRSGQGHGTWRTDKPQAASVPPSATSDEIHGHWEGLSLDANDSELTMPVHMIARPRASHWPTVSFDARKTPTKTGDAILSISMLSESHPSHWARTGSQMFNV